MKKIAIVALLAVSSTLALYAGIKQHNARLEKAQTECCNQTECCLVGGTEKFCKIECG